MRRYYRFILPALLLALSISFEIFAAFTIWEVLGEKSEPFFGPGTTTVQVSNPGKYTLWKETKTMIDGKVLSFPEDLPSGTTFVVTRQSTGEKIPLQTGVSETMSINNVTRIAVGRLELKEAGEYTVTVTGLNEQRTFSVSKSFLGKFFVGVFAGGVGFILFLGSIALFIYLFLRRPKPELQSLRPV